MRAHAAKQGRKPQSPSPPEVFLEGRVLTQSQVHRKSRHGWGFGRWMRATVDACYSKKLAQSSGQIAGSRAEMRIRIPWLVSPCAAQQSPSGSIADTEVQCGNRQPFSCTQRWSLERPLLPKGSPVAPHQASGRPVMDGDPPSMVHLSPGPHGYKHTHGNLPAANSPPPLRNRAAVACLARSLCRDRQVTMDRHESSQNTQT